MANERSMSMPDEPQEGSMPMGEPDQESMSVRPPGQDSV